MTYRPHETEQIAVSDATFETRRPVPISTSSPSRSPISAQVKTSDPTQAPTALLGRADQGYPASDGSLGDARPPRLGSLPGRCRAAWLHGCLRAPAPPSRPADARRRSGSDRTDSSPGSRRWREGTGFPARSARPPSCRACPRRRRSGRRLPAGGGRGRTTSDETGLQLRYKLVNARRPTSASKL